MTDNTRDSRFTPSTPQGVKATTNIDADALDTSDIVRDAAPSAGDKSPHLGGRAQPGDILGIETGGETTTIGDTTEDEDKRRVALEKEVAKEVERVRAEQKDR